MSRAILTRTEKRKGKNQSPRGKRKKESGRQPSSVSSRRTPPVLSRSEIGMNTAVLNNRSVPRRRVDVSLSSPGAEIRLPAVPTVSNKWRVVSGILAVSIFMVLILVTKAGHFQVNSVQTEGLERFTEGEIKQAINITGSSIFFVNPKSIKADLYHTYPGLSEVNVQVSWRSQVVISLVERNPVMAWNWDGHVRWVDANGVAFEPHDEGLNVVQVNSDILPPTIKDRFVDPRIVKTVETLALYIPENTQMIFDPEHGLGWHDSRGWVVYFGLNNDDAAQKMIVYTALIEYLKKKGITPGMINVEFIEAPYFRMES